MDMDVPVPGVPPAVTALVARAECEVQWHHYALAGETYLRAAEAAHGIRAYRYLLFNAAASFQLAGESAQARRYFMQACEAQEDSLCARAREAMRDLPVEPSAHPLGPVLLGTAGAFVIAAAIFVGVALGAGPNDRDIWLGTDAALWISAGTAATIGLVLTLALREGDI
jgi:hypothetical protein